jgi:hypothetical protein
MLHPHLLGLGSLTALGLLLGCNETSPVSPSPASPLPQANASRERPWKESYRATGTIARDARCPSPPAVPPPGQFLVSLEGGGTATHVGKYTITNSHCVDASTGLLTGGAFVKTAANGDQLSGTYEGRATPAADGSFSVDGRITFTGGTGRFAGATGSTNMAGTLQADFSGAPPWPTQVTLTMIGTISY